MPTDRADPASILGALATVRRLSFAVLEAETADDVHRQLALELFRAFGVSQVHINRLARDATLARGTLYRRDGAGVVVAHEYVVALDMASAVLDVVRSGEPFNEPDARDSSVLAPELADAFRAESALFVPLAFEGEVRNVVTLVSEEPRPFSDEDVQLAHTLANQASAALAGLEMKGRTSARAEQQAALARAASTLNARLDRKAVLETLCREADLALGGDLALVYLGDAVSGGVGVAGDAMPEDDDWYGSVIRPGEGVAGQVLVTGEPAISSCYQIDVRVPDNELLWPIEAAVSVPVRWNGELKGALAVAFYAMRRITDEDIESLQAIADLAAVACSNAEAYERAQQAARTDSLTGVLNHGAVQARLFEEIERARREDALVSCLVVDLDNFKPINDSHGHLVGDQILQDVASGIASEFRPYDGIGRLGGDEFVLVLPGAGTEEALVAAHKVQRIVDAIGRASGVPKIDLTASLGISSWREPLTAAELLDRADRALLVAKRRGKDRAVIADHHTEEEIARLEVDAGSPAQLLSDLWDMVSQCKRPGDVLDSLPGFLEEVLELDGALLVPAAELTDIDYLAARLRSGPVSRPTLAGLHEALGPSAGSIGGDGARGSHAALAVGRDDVLHGVLVLRSPAPHFPLPVLRLAELLTGQAVTAMLGQLGGASRSAVGALAAAIDARDNYTHTHSEQVVGMVSEVAGRLGLAPAELERLRDAAMLHDVGKVAIPNEILYKPGPLTVEEWEVMREHPLIGERILRRTPELAAMAPLVRHEHERWDGRGYPDGLAGEEIPVGSRIIFACDAYSAMITTRPYREPMSHEAALEELRKGAGSQFDPHVVSCLLAVLDEGA